MNGAVTQALQTANRSAATALGLAVAVACAVPETLWLPAPSTDSARTAIVFLEWSNQRRAYVQTVSDDALQFPALDWVDGPPDDYRVTVALYAPSPVELGLTTGPLPAAVVPQTCAPLNVPASVMVLDVDEGVYEDWQADTLTDAHRTHLTTGETCIADSPCPRYEAEFLLLPVRTNVRRMVAGQATNEVLMLQSSVGDNPALGPLTVIQTTDETFTLRQVGEYRANAAMTKRPDGTLFLGGARGYVAQGPVDEPGRLVESKVFEDRYNIVAMVAADDDSGDVYGLAELKDPDGVARAVFLEYSGDVERGLVDGSLWTITSTFTVRNIKVPQSNLLWLGPDEVIGAYGDDKLLYVRDGQYQAVAVDFSSGTPALQNIVETTDARGRSVLFAGAANGLLYSSVPDAPRAEWNFLGRPTDFGEGILSSKATASNEVFLGSSNGLYSVFHTTFGFCPTDESSTGDIEAIGQTRHGVLVAGDKLNDGSYRIALLRRGPDED